MLQLHIFQLDEYNIGKFFRWIFSHFFTRTLENKKKFIMTSKAKVILILAGMLVIVMFMSLGIMFHWIGLLVGVILATQAYFFLAIAYALLLPYQLYKRKKVKISTEKKLLSMPHVKVIGITGSYGKTSVKEFLYAILKTKYKVLRTPGSYNTPLGIAKVVDLELDNSYEYFICEMGAYRRGEIKEICDMVHPTYGILTGINEQHIETFGSLENTTKGKFELIDALPENGFGVVNGDNVLIRNYVESEPHPSPLLKGERKNSVSKEIIMYGFSDKKFLITNIVQTHEGSSFTLVLDGKEYKAKTKLFGKSNLQNILGAATMSYLLHMTPQEIVKAIAMLESVAHRLEIKHLKDITIIDDAYNSNVDGFQEAIALLSSFDTPKILVTPGIVDLGNRTIQIHESLGKLLGTVDYVFLVGESDRTKGLAMGIENKKKVIKLHSIREVWGEIDKLDLQNPVVLLENDLPDNY